MANADTSIVDVTLTPQQVYIRRRIFYGVFVVLWVLYLLLVVTYFVPGLQEVSKFTMKSVALMAPTIKADIPVLGDLVPALLGAVIAATAPPQASNRQLITVLACALITYLMYVHTTVFLSTAADGSLQTEGLQSAIIGLGLSPQDDVSTIRSLASSARNFSVFVFAALIGIRFNSSGKVSVPFLGGQKPSETPAVPDGWTITAQSSTVDPNIPAADESDQQLPAEGAANG